MKRYSETGVETSINTGMREPYADQIRWSPGVNPDHFEIAPQAGQPSLRSRSNKCFRDITVGTDPADDITRDTTATPPLNIHGSVPGHLLAGFDACRREHGSNLIEVSFILPLLVMLVAGAVDLGRALYYSNNLTRAAGSSAMYGTQNPTDVTGMENMAKADASGVPGITATASYGCECPDGSKASASCAIQPSCTGSTPVYYVTVKATADLNTVIQWPGVTYPLSISSTSTMRGGE